MHPVCTLDGFDLLDVIVGSITTSASTGIEKTARIAAGSTAILSRPAALLHFHFAKSVTAEPRSNVEDMPGS